MGKKVILTEEGLKKLEAELDNLKTVKRKEVAEKIKVALSFGDLSENSEYDEAKNEQAQIEARILVIEEQLKSVRIVDKSSLSKDVVGIGSQVKIWDCKYEEELEYRIVSSLEGSQQMNTITDKSPVGEALLGHKVGDEVEVHAPKGSFMVKILEIGI